MTKINEVERTQKALIQRIRQLEVEIVSRGILPVSYLREIEENITANGVALVVVGLILMATYFLLKV